MQSGKRQVLRKFFWFFIGYFFTYGAYYSILLLQSSINIKDGVGVTSASVTYGCSVVFSIFLAPILLRVLGERYSAIVGQVTFLIYILANFYPEPYILIPAAALVAVGEATMWPTLLLFTVHYARCYARHANKDTSAYETMFVGIYFSGFYLSQIFANLLSYGILFGGKNLFGNQNQSTVDFSHCGANDCQDPNTTNENIDMYVPTSQITLYLVLGVMAGLLVVSIIVYLTMLKDIDVSLEAVNLETQTSEEAALKNQETKQTSDTRSERERTNPNEVHFKTKNGFAPVLSSIKETFSLLFHPQQLLLAPFALYSGMYVAFIMSDISRAYGSCLFGVQQIGLNMALHSAAGGIWSMLASSLSSRYGRRVTIMLGFGIDLSCWLFLLFWQPSSQNLGWTYAIYVTTAFASITWITTISDTYVDYFSKKRDIAFVVWNLWMMVGIAVQFGWSTSLCVRTKIYVQIGILCFSTLTYGVADYIQRNKDKHG